MTYTGIDYGLGLSNINNETGIRFGVISVHAIDYWYEDSEADYPECEECPEGECQCDIEPLCFYVKTDEYLATQSGGDCDIFIERSPYFTYAQFCSPCAPGACYLGNPLDEPNKANKCYCFGPDWFEGKPPYPVYSVKTGELI